MWVKPSSTTQTITFQFMEAIQSEFWESSFTLKSTDGQTIGLPLTKEYFHHPAWFHGAEADNVIDLGNIKLVSLYVGGPEARRVIFRDIRAVKTLPAYTYQPATATGITLALTETGRCATPK